MAVEWKALRLRAGMSLERAGAQAGVTSATAKIFELDPEAIRNPAKRAALVRVYQTYALAPARSEAREGEESAESLPASLVGKGAR